jgi:hypothetical protein
MCAVSHTWLVPSRLEPTLQGTYLASSVFSGVFGRSAKTMSFSNTSGTVEVRPLRAIIYLVAGAMMSALLAIAACDGAPILLRLAGRMFGR